MALDSSEDEGRYVLTGGVVAPESPKFSGGGHVSPVMHSPLSSESSHGFKIVWEPPRPSKSEEVSAPGVALTFPATSSEFVAGSEKEALGLKRNPSRACRVSGCRSVAASGSHTSNDTEGPVRKSVSQSVG